MQSSRAAVFTGFQFCNAAYQRHASLNARSLQERREPIKSWATLSAIELHACATRLNASVADHFLHSHDRWRQGAWLFALCVIQAPLDWRDKAEPDRPEAPRRDAERVVQKRTARARNLRQYADVSAPGFLADRLSVPSLQQCPGFEFRRELRQRRLDIRHRSAQAAGRAVAARRRAGRAGATLRALALRAAGCADFDDPSAAAFDTRAPGTGSTLRSSSSQSACSITRGTG